MQILNAGNIGNYLRKALFEIMSYILAPQCENPLSDCVLLGIDIDAWPIQND